jgi:hypothetical protein
LADRQLAFAAEAGYDEYRTNDLTL